MTTDSTLLTKLRFRHDALVLMYRAREILKQLNETYCSFTYEEETYNTLREQRQLIFDETKTSSLNIKAWMERTNNKRDEILNQICEDLYITAHSLQNTQHSGMYLNSRFTSQGYQRGYSVTLPPENIIQRDHMPWPVPLLRSANASTVDNTTLGNDITQLYVPQRLRRESSAYSTRSQRETMTDVNSIT